MIPLYVKRFARGVIAWFRRELSSCGPAGRHVERAPLSWPLCLSLVSPHSRRAARRVPRAPFPTRGRRRGRRRAPVLSGLRGVRGAVSVQRCNAAVLQCAESAAAVRRPGRDVRARARPVGRCGRLAAGRSALHTHPDTQDTNSVEWHFYFRILWGADGSQQSM